MKIEDWQSTCPPNWCPGCGNFGLWQALKQALTDLGQDPGETLLVAGIGCHGHINNFTQCSSFEGLHGRPIPVAVGAKMANHGLNVIVSTGDGDCLGEGGNHLVHACRRNHNLMVMIHDNASYSLTTGQTSPASPKGYVSKSTPEGKLEEPLNPVSLALSAGATFVARGFTGAIPQLTEIFKKAMEHEGIAIVDILQPCVVFNKQFTFDYFQKKVSPVEIAPTRAKAYELSLVWGEKIPTGIFYQEKKPAYESLVENLKKGPLVAQPVKTGKKTFLTREFF